MLQQSPEYRRLDRLASVKLSDSYVIEEKATRLEQRRAARIKRAYGATALGLVLAANVGAYAADVHANMELQANASIGISVLGDAHEKSDASNALVFVDGFGSYDSISLTNSLGKAYQPTVDGQLWSVNYNNAILNRTAIADKIVETAEARGVTSVSLVGYSAGGAISAELVQELTKKNIDINLIAFNSTPNGAGGLRSERQNEIGLVEKIKHIPGAQYSTPLRFLGEMAFRSGAYTAPLDGDSLPENTQTFGQNIAHFFDTAGNVRRDMRENKMPGTWLMFDQVLAIENANIKDRIEELGDLPDTKIHPTIVYLGTGAPGYDYMVDDKKSAAEIGQYAADAGLPFYTAEVPGAIHSRPDLTVDAYVKTLTSMQDSIQDSIDEQRGIAYANQLAERYATHDAHNGTNAESGTYPDGGDHAAAAPDGSVPQPEATANPNAADR